MPGYAKSLGKNGILKILRSSYRPLSVVMKIREMFTLNLKSAFLNGSAFLSDMLIVPSY